MIAYVAERFSPAIFLPAAAAIALVSHRAGGHAGDSWLVDVLLALLMIAQFRLWDDLADRDIDRHSHPERVLVRAKSTTRYVAICLLLVEVNAVAAWWRTGLAGLVAFAILHLVVGGWYVCRPGRRTIAGDLLVLSKYPAFVVVLSAEPTSPSLALVLGASAVYVGACLFEIWHDSSSPLARVTS